LAGCLLSPQQTAKLLGIGERKLKQLTRTGQISTDSYVVIPSSTGNSRYDRTKYDLDLVKESLRNISPQNKPKEQILKDLAKDFAIRYGNDLSEM